MIPKRKMRMRRKMGKRVGMSRKMKRTRMMRKKRRNVMPRVSYLLPRSDSADI